MNSSTSNSNSFRKGIKKYLAGFFLFLFFVFAFDRTLVYLLWKAEANFYTKNKFEQRFEKYVKGKEFSTLIFGTSRSYEAIHPYYIEKELGERVFKEAYQGKGPKYNYYFYQLYKKYAGIPKVVIYGVDYFIYTVTSDPKYMARFDIENKDKEEEIDFFSSPLMLVKHKRKLDNFQNNILIYLKENGSPDREAGSVKDFVDIHKYTGALNANKKIIARRPHRYRRQFYPRFPGKEGRYFVDLLDLLDRDNVTVVLVIIPDYFGTFKTNFQREKFIQHLKTFKRTHKKLFIYNYNRPRNFPLNNVEYFMDGGYGISNSHLSQKGARRFNKLLVQDLRKHYR